MSNLGCDCHPRVSRVTAVCPSCLYDRLSDLSDPNPDLRRSKSHSSSKHISVSVIGRKSCDSRLRTSLSHLFKSDDINDLKDPVLIQSNQVRPKDDELDITLVGNEVDNERERDDGFALKSMKEYIEVMGIVNDKSCRDLSRFGEYLGFNEAVNDDEKNVVKGSEITDIINRDLSRLDKELGANEVESEKSEEEEAKPMKEHIEIELESYRKRYSGLWGGVFTQKLRKWKLKQQPIDPKEGFKAESVVGRRKSCDIEPRFSVEENTSRVSFDEPRGSWDGYMMAKTIPRLAPMLSVIENHMGVEDETNSVSESSSSARRNSFDCSSSGKSSGLNRTHVEIDDLKVKVLSTGLDTGRLEVDMYEDRVKKSGSLKKKVLRILGFNLKSKCTETREIEVVNEVSSGNVVRRKSDVGSYKTVDSFCRSPNVGEIRGQMIPFDRTRSVRYSPSPINFENGLLRFHLTPPLSRKKKPERRSSVLNSKGVSRIS